jgi:predicted anti-sigma-YlaC factor YlaD
VTCEQVREQLAEHLLGTLDETSDGEVRIHLRGCASCRAELRAMADGVGTFAAAAHDVDPPGDLRQRVLTTLDEEWASAAPTHDRSGRLGRVAVIAALAAALAWGAVATILASSYEEAADKYEAFLAELGGENVRVGALRAQGSQDLQGSVVIYESNAGQSWALVLFRAPGRQGTVNVTMLAGQDRRIDLRPMDLGPGGEGSTWLVTSSDLASYNRVNLWDENGVLASARIEST